MNRQLNHCDYCTIGNFNSFRFLHQRFFQYVKFHLLLVFLLFANQQLHAQDKGDHEFTIGYGYYTIQYFAFADNP